MSKTAQHGHEWHVSHNSRARAKLWHQNTNIYQTRTLNKARVVKGRIPEYISELAKVTGNTLSNAGKAVCDYIRRTCTFANCRTCSKRLNIHCILPPCKCATGKCRMPRQHPHAKKFYFLCCCCNGVKKVAVATATCLFLKRAYVKKLYGS